MQPNPVISVPPVLVQLTPAGGVSLSAKGRTNMPQALLPTKVDSITVSFRPPEMVMPVPSGPSAAVPE